MFNSAKIELPRGLVFSLGTTRAASIKHETFIAFKTGFQMGQKFLSEKLSMTGSVGSFNSSNRDTTVTGMFLKE